MLIQMVLLFVVLGMLANAILHFVTKKGNFWILLLVGACVGWFAGMLWVLFSGLTVTVIDIVATLIASIIPSLLIIYGLPIPFTKKWHTPTAIATLLLLVFLVSAVYISLPQSYPAVANTQSLIQYASNVDVVKTLEIDRSNIDNFIAPQSTNEIGITFTKANIQAFSTNATENQYLKFRITFSVSKADWVKPFITFGIFKDNDNDGKISAGDVLWEATNYKVITNSGYWRANLYYENDQPKYEIFGSDEGLLPIFHASQLSVWKDDTQYIFANTPEGYKPPQDMLSWSNDIHVPLKENVLAYATIPAGQTSYIEGKIYCPPESEGNYYIVVRAYDARFTDPYNPSQPLAEKIIPFTISKTPKPEVGIDVLMIVSFALPSAVAILLAKKW